MAEKKYTNILSAEDLALFRHLLASYVGRGGVLSPLQRDVSFRQYEHDFDPDLYYLSNLLKRFHVADIADVLESLPPEERLFVWSLVASEQKGHVLLEVSDSVREGLIPTLGHEDLKGIAAQLSTDEVAYLAHDLPENALEDVLSVLNSKEQSQVRSSLSYPEDKVGALVDFDSIQIKPDAMCSTVLRYLRSFDNLPSQTDKLFVVDSRHRLLGILSLETLLTSPPEKSVEEVMSRDFVSFYPDQLAEEAAKAFERYDLVTAPIIDHNTLFIGRLTVDTMLDVLLEQSESETLNIAGLTEEEDLFAPVTKSIKNRWTWLAINLCTALIASKIISFFEGTIQQLVALATLMPIVAGMGGNSGNQTTTMIVRALAVGQLQFSDGIRLWRKEMRLALINGMVWGSALGIIAWLMYRDLKLGMVMATATTLNFMLAATVGVWMPIMMAKLGRDPAVGSSVMITACTDSGGFFIFLGLASVFLI